jgi:hypothetical protein
MDIFEQLSRARAGLEYVGGILNACGLADWERYEYEQTRATLAHSAAEIARRRRSACTRYSSWPASKT